jgi:N-acetylmuramoyl-L-alanine amidase-like protein
MSERALTRRSLLAGGAGVALGGLLRPHAALAALGAPAPARLAARDVGEVGPLAKTVALARPADLVGLEWTAPAGAQPMLRFRAAGGGWSPWLPAGGHGHGPEHAVGATSVGEPVWTGGTSELQLRSARALTGARLHLVDVSEGVGARLLHRGAAGALAAAQPLPLATPRIAAGAGQPPIIARRAWARGVSPPRVTPAYGAVRLGFVHHTENANGYSAREVPAMLRAIYAFHRFVNGWDDIGYNFVVDLYGRVFEARAGGIDEPVAGAQAGGYNLVSTGVAVLGSFSSVAISPAALATLERLLAWKLSLHGVPATGRVLVKVNPAGAGYSRFPANAIVPLPRIAGHRDADSTECPGDRLYGELPAARRRVRGLAGRPSRLTLALAAPAPAPPEATPGAPGQVPAQPLAAQSPAGTLAFLDGTPISGATVLVQARTVSAKGEVVLEQTLAQAITGARGEWSAPGAYVPSADGAIALRALCPAVPGGSGATVSEPLTVAAAVPVSSLPGSAPSARAAPPGGA